MIKIKGFILLIILCLSLFACRSQKKDSGNEKFSDQLAKDFISRFPDPDTIHWVGDTNHFSWQAGYIMFALEKMWYNTGDSVYYNYIKRYADQHVDEQGKVPDFVNNALDNFLPGYAILFMYEQTGQEKYKKAAKYIRDGFNGYPRAGNGLFWHSSQEWARGQVWVDGVFMGQIFLARYGKMMGDSLAFNEVVKQMTLIIDKCQKENGLLLHGWNEDKTAAWADKNTGLAPEVWSEGLGWFAVLIADVFDYLPSNQAGLDSLSGMLKKLCYGLKNTADPKTGMWCQVVDKPGEPGNWNETSGTGMFIYLLQKSIDKGYISPAEFQPVVNKACKSLTKKVVKNKQGFIDLLDCSSIGILNSYADYISQPKEVSTFAAFGSVIIGTSIYEMHASVQQIEVKIQHPRILLLKGEESSIRKSISANPTWEKMHLAILQECDNMITLPMLERIQIGRRLLDKSRECLRRVFYLSYAYRMTGDEKYFLRAETEMLNVSRFSDWNPPHFLDVAEMTMGMAIGYDWLYDRLSPESKKIIREAIIRNGLVPSLDEKNAWFLDSNHNWNQVCNAGMTYGALAIYEDSTEFTKTIIRRAIRSIHLPMEEYGPDGAYPEGYSYWDYGTSFNVMFLSAIEKAFATDFGLCKVPGFLKTSGFLENMTGVTCKCYNWGDCGQGSQLNPAMFWFAGKNNDPSLLWVEKSQLLTTDYSKFTDDRLLPALMIWNGNVALDKITEPVSKVWTGQGLNPVCLMRTSWTDPNAIYLGFKAGSASVNHGHMDIGSFIMESDGVRWASDLGMQEYETLESKGIQVFGRTQDAERWSILRLNNYFHNTLTIDNQLQLVKGYAKIDKFSDKPGFSYAVSDLSSVYENQLLSAIRGVGIVNSKYVVIRDELEGGNKTCEVRWAMLTRADVEITGKNSVTLTKDGKTLYLKLTGTPGISIKTRTTQPTTNYDAPNPGTVLLCFSFTLPAKQKETLQVLLVPGSAKTEKTDFDKLLKDW